MIRVTAATAARAAAGLLCAAMLAAPGAALASTFSDCDGYGLPSASGDGMTSYANVLGIFNPPGYGNTARTAVNQREVGVEACDAALADPRLSPAFWGRRVSLLAARAMHRLEMGDAKAALADLDLARAAVKDPADVYFARSLGLELDFVRAYALRAAGDQAGASALAVRTWRRRPWNRETPISAAIAMGPGAAAADADTIALAQARLSPQAIDDDYFRLFGKGRWADALALQSQLTLPKVKVNTYGGWRLETLDRLQAEQFWVLVGCTRAYALAALGRPAEARAAMAATRERLLRVTAPPADPAAATRPATTPAEIAAETRILQEATLRAGAVKQLDLWAAFVDRRALIDEGHAAEAFKALQARPPAPGPMSDNLIAALLAARPALDPASLAALRALRDRAPPPAPPVAAPSLAALFQTLPEAETAARLTPYRRRDTGFGIGGDHINGYGDSPAAPAPAAESPSPYGPDGDITVVTFNAQHSPEAVVEELALLHAADLARRQGRKGMIIVDRADTRHSISNQYRSDPMGYDTRLSLVFVDPAQLPPRYADAGWRVIDPDAVYADLAPVYAPPPAQAPAAAPGR